MRIPKGGTPLPLPHLRVRKNEQQNRMKRNSELLQLREKKKLRHESVIRQIHAVYFKDGGVSPFIDVVLRCLHKRITVSLLKLLRKFKFQDAIFYNNVVLTFAHDSHIPVTFAPTFAVE